MQKKIGILGGSFDPFHFGHLRIAALSKQLLSLDFVYFIPTYRNPFKEKTSSPHHRLEMLKIALLGQENFIYDIFEINSPSPSYTIKTLQYLKQKHPNDEIFFLGGTDLLEDLYQWEEIENILKLATFVLYERNTPPIPKKSVELLQTFSTSFKLMEPMIPNISSTMIRDLRKKNITIEYLVPEKVYDYIKQNNLYKKEDPLLNESPF